MQKEQASAIMHVTTQKTVFDHISKHREEISAKTRSGVLLTNFEVFWNVLTVCGCLIYCIFSIETKM